MVTQDLHKPAIMHKLETGTVWEGGYTAGSLEHKNPEWLSAIRWHNCMYVVVADFFDPLVHYATTTYMQTVQSQCNHLTTKMFLNKMLNLQCCIYYCEGMASE